MKKVSDEKVEKVIRKYVIVLDAEKTDSQLKSKYKKWQLWFSKAIGVTPADNYQYVFRINYKSVRRSKLKINDIICNEDGVIFVVMQEMNRMALLVSSESFPVPPKMYGKLHIISNLKNESKK